MLLLLLLLLLTDIWVSSVSALSLSSNNNQRTSLAKTTSRRTALAQLVTLPIVGCFSNTPSVAAEESSSATSESSATTKGGSINSYTVVIDSSDTAESVGLTLEDVDFGDRTYPVVKSATDLAASSGVKPGMILFSDGSVSKFFKGSVESRIRKGPYPFVLKFYDSPENDAQTTARKLKEERDNSMATTQQDITLLSPYDRMATKTVYMPKPCGPKAQRGDTVEIIYEARIGSKDGPIYDSSASRQGAVQFELGKSQVIPGVDAATQGMCVGEIKEMDVNTQLGYGKMGSSAFDIPGDVRLWWRVELANVSPASKKRGGGVSSSEWSWGH